MIRKRITFDLHNWPRLFSFPLPVLGFGWVPQNFHSPFKYVREDIIFSITFRGKEIHNYSEDGELANVSLPALTCILPGTRRWSETKYPWDELFFVYHASMAETFEKFGIDLQSMSRAPLHITNQALLERQIDDVLEICQQSQLPGMADRLDVILYSVIISHWVESGLSQNQHVSVNIRLALEYLQRGFRNHLVLADLLHKLGMSERSFRREWARYIDTPVHTYLIDLRLAYVRQLLLNTNMSLKEIAENSGFGSSIDVCRHFQRHFHFSPGELRRHGKSPEKEC